MPVPPLLGTPLHDRSFYHILGGGIAGLLMGYYLRKQGVPFRIYEQAACTGGLIRTQHTPYGPAEAAANGLIGSPAVHAMLQNLGLELLDPLPEAKTKYFVREAENGSWYFSRNPLRRRELLQVLWCAMRPAFGRDETLEETALRHAGQPFARYLLEPGLQGIYAAPLRKLGYRAVLPDLYRWHRRVPFLPLAWMLHRMTSPAKRYPYIGVTGGMQALTRALSNYLDDAIVYGFDAATLQPEMHRGKLTDNFIVCLPAHRAAPLFEDTPVRDVLQGVRYQPVASMTSFWKAGSLKRCPPGFGCLVPRHLGLHTMGLLFNHHIYPGRVTGEARYSITSIADMEGLLRPGTEKTSEEVLLKEAGTLLQAQHNPLHVELFKHPRGIPLYDKALPKRWNQIHQYLKAEMPAVRLFGNYTGRIAIRGMVEAAYSGAARISR